MHEAFRGRVVDSHRETHGATAPDAKVGTTPPDIREQAKLRVDPLWHARELDDRDPSLRANRQESTEGCLHTALRSCTRFTFTRCERERISSPGARPAR